MKLFPSPSEREDAVGHPTHRDASHAIDAVFDAPLPQQSQLGFPSILSISASMFEQLCSVSAFAFSVSRRILA